MLINGGSASGKTNVLLNLIKHQEADIENNYLYVKDPFESRYQLFITGQKKRKIKKSKSPKTFIYYSQTMDDVYENLQDY